MRLHATPRKKALAAYMSRHKSWPEKRLWAKLKGNQLGVAFYSQRVILGYIADFWCPKAKLVVETDGKQHLRKKAVAYDKHRDEVLAREGIKTIRFTATEVFNNLPAVVVLIQEEVRKRLTRSARVRS